MGILDALKSAVIAKPIPLSDGSYNFCRLLIVLHHKGMI